MIFIESSISVRSEDPDVVICFSLYSVPDTTVLVNTVLYTTAQSISAGSASSANPPHWLRCVCNIITRSLLFMLAVKVLQYSPELQVSPFRQYIYEISAAVEAEEVTTAANTFSSV